MKSALMLVGFYVSPAGGAPAPATIHEGQMLFEMITAGSVYSPTGELCHAGWVFCHAAGEQTVWQSEGDSHYECLVARFDLSQVTRAEVWPRAFHWRDAEGAVAFGHEVLYAFHHTAVANDILGDLIWSQLRFRLDEYRRHQAAQVVPAVVRRSVRYLERHFARDVSIVELASAAGLSASHLHSQFKRHMGMSPHQYVIHRRMREARQLLVTTDDPIKAISENVGYANAENFCRVFRKHAKTSAAQYRRKYTRIGI